MDEHTAKAFDADLAEISGKIKAMAQLIEQQIDSASSVLASGDTVLARQVVAVDDRVDALQREIEEKAVITIARRQPVAVDLREVVGALRISNDLERIGDLAENVAKRALLSAQEFRMINGVTLQLQHMFELVLEQLKAVIQSYTAKDTGAASTSTSKRSARSSRATFVVAPADHNIVKAVKQGAREMGARGQPKAAE